MNKLIMAMVVAALATGVEAKQVMRPQRVKRGATGTAPQSYIDRAAWIVHPDYAGLDKYYPKGLTVLRYRCEFDVKAGREKVDFDVSGDERYYLTCDGEFVSRGPHRGTRQNWMYQSYELTLKPGRHVFEAVVWKHGPYNAPLQQMSLRLGFALGAAEPYAKTLSTGFGDWQVGIVEGCSENGRDGQVWGAGEQVKLVGSGVYDLKPAKYVKAVKIAEPVVYSEYGGAKWNVWQLYPTQERDQTEYRCRPGKFVEGGIAAGTLFAANTVTTNLWDLGKYYCAYPILETKGGKGAEVEWKWAESLYHPNDARRHGYKGNRNEWKGKLFSGFGDTFVSDGRADAVFSPTWFRCGRWCRIIVKTGAEPLTVRGISIVESRYPLEMESKFESPDMPSLGPIQQISTRGMQMCCHELLFDCPYYEQQMYPGDTRLQLNIISSLTADDAMVKRPIEVYDYAKFADGLVPFNYPTLGRQEGLTYTICYLLMHPDYLMFHSNREWLKARLPGYRNTMHGVESYEEENGMLVNIPGWSFIDWPKGNGWYGGWAPETHKKDKPSAVINGYWILAMRGAAKMERAFGNPELAAYWERKIAKASAEFVRIFWDEQRGLFADDPEHKYWSEHPQTMALLADIVTGERAKKCFNALIADETLTRTTVYFKYYLFETLFKFGRADLFFKELALWQSYVDSGCTTCIEEPETESHSSRSDCHAWGSHPIFFLRTGVAGIMPASPFYEKVRVAPQPGPLTSFKASWPHPSGKMIELDFGPKKATVTTPVEGEFVWNGKTVPLKAGKNDIAL